MTSIIVQRLKKKDGTAIGSQDDKRRYGMRHAGKELRERLKGIKGPGASAKTKVKTKVNEFVEELIVDSNFELYVETRTNDKDDPKANTKTYAVSGSAPNYDLTEVGAKKPEKRNLTIDGEIDDYEKKKAKGKGKNRMTVVSPYNASEDSWEYLSNVVYKDLQEIQKEIDAGTSPKEAVEDYLIATFAFTRCR